MQEHLQRKMLGPCLLPESIPNPFWNAVSPHGAWDALSVSDWCCWDPSFPAADVQEPEESLEGFGSQLSGQERENPTWQLLEELLEEKMLL